MSTPQQPNLEFLDVVEHARRIFGELPRVWLRTADGQAVGAVRVAALPGYRLPSRSRATQSPPTFQRRYSGRRA